MEKGPSSLQGKKYPAKNHARSVYRHFKDKKNLVLDETVAFFVSGEALELYQYCDQTKPLRQNRYFFYLSGVAIPGSHVLYEPLKDKLTLFLPDVDEDDIMWSGLPLSAKEAAAKYDIDHVLYASDIPQTLEAVNTKAKVYTTDVNKFNSNYAKYLVEGDADFFYALDESRLCKDSYEIELMRHAARITDNCHLAVMSATPIETNETHIHAEFMYHALRQGSKNQSYDPICCSGPNCSTLHYVKNDDSIDPSRRSVLIDAGAEWECYASDVTRCFPINGDWSKEHREIYDIVLRMQLDTMALIKPGVLWDDVHIHAHKVLIENFLRLGIFKKEYLAEEIFESKISSGFFPHGLGHLLGMDTHDVGGRPNYDDPNPLLRYLRLRRHLQVGMVLTDEPGVYFSPFLLKEILEDSSKSKYIDRDVLDKYWYIGGVRIEDDLVITDSGFENLTKITSDPEEISKIVKKGLSKGKYGFNAGLHDYQY